MTALGEERCRRLVGKEMKLGLAVSEDLRSVYERKVTAGVNPDRMYVAERPGGGVDLMSLDGRPFVAGGGSREEMDLKLAAMGFEAGWGVEIGFPGSRGFHPVRRIL